MRRWVPGVLALLVGVTVLAGAVGPVASSSTPVDVAITDVSVSPESPVPRETVTMTTTIQSFEGSTETFVVDAVALRNGYGQRFDEFDRVEDPGRLSPGTSLRVPLTRSYSSPGTKEFRIVVFGHTDSDESIQLTYPATVRVTDAKPKVEIDVGDPVEGAETTANVTFANGLDRDLRNVEVTLGGDVEVDQPRQIRSTLPAGETASFQFDVVPPAAGATDVSATVEYTLADGPTRSVSTTTSVQTRTLGDRVSLSTNVSGGRIAVTATNLGNVDVENLVVSGSSDDATVGDGVISRLATGESRTVVLPVESISSPDGVAAVDVSGSYEAGDRIRETGAGAGSVTLRRLVTLNASATEGGVSVQVANLGNLRVDRVVVRGSSENATVGQAVVPSLGPGETATVTVPVRDQDGVAAIDLHASYEVGSSVASTRGERVTVRANPGRIELTGLDIQSEDGHLTISGSASNVGLSDVDSVVVRVVPSEGVTPVSPNREYFVGTVPASDFVSFDVTARVDENTTTVPLEVTYLSDGERRLERVPVQVREGSALTPVPERSGNAGLLVPALVGGVIVLIVGAIIFVGWRNRRVGD